MDERATAVQETPGLVLKLEAFSGAHENLQIMCKLEKGKGTTHNSRELADKGRV